MFFLKIKEEKKNSKIPENWNAQKVVFEVCEKKKEFKLQARKIIFFYFFWRERERKLKTQNYKTTINEIKINIFII